MDLSERLAHLGEILVALSSTPVPSQQFQTLADQAHLVIANDYLAVCLVDPDESGYLVHSLAGLAAGAIPQRLFRLEEGLIGHVIQTNRSLSVDDLAAFPEAAADLEGMCGRLGLRTALVVPLRQGDRVLGALFFAARPPVQYGQDELQVGKLMAAGLSASLETSRLYQALADERSTLAAVLSSSQDAVLMVNGQGIVLLANPAVGKMLGLDVTTITGRPLAAAVDDPALLALFAGEPLALQEVALPQGRTAQASLVPVVNDYGESIGWAAVFRDISLFKELEQMKNEFVNTVSHDLKNPISTIMLAAGLMDRVGDLNEQQVQMKKRITKTAEYMNELVGDLLDLGRIEAGMGFTAVPLDLTELVQETLVTLRPNAEARQQQLKDTLEIGIEVSGDRGRLRQVILNLIGNAIKYTPDGGLVEVRLASTNSCARLQVIDDGIGIAARHLPYVFDKFYRVTSEETEQIKGTGLGLAICKGIVEAHDGRVRVESAPGKGSCFTVELPGSSR